MSLRYMFADERKTLAHPFHVKCTWQPPIQNSVALERYLEETKLELASTVFLAPLDNSELKIRRRRDSTTADLVEGAWGEVAVAVARKIALRKLARRRVVVATFPVEI